jgi:hypothetical protein
VLHVIELRGDGDKSLIHAWRVGVKETE